jgi:hypothetical protein
MRRCEERERRGERETEGLGDGEKERGRDLEMGRLSERENWEKITEVINENKIT